MPKVEVVIRNIAPTHHGNLIVDDEHLPVGAMLHAEDPGHRTRIVIADINTGLAQHSSKRGTQLEDRNGEIYENANSHPTPRFLCESLSHNPTRGIYLIDEKLKVNRLLSTLDEF